jgi:hypothetical protein
MITGSYVAGGAWAGGAVAGGAVADGIVASGAVAGDAVLGGLAVVEVGGETADATGFAPFGTTSIATKAQLSFPDALAVRETSDPATVRKRACSTHIVASSTVSNACWSIICPRLTVFVVWSL